MRPLQAWRKRFSNFLRLCISDGNPLSLYAPESYNYSIIEMDMSVSCSSCGRKVQDYPVFCYMCDDYFCSEKCHEDTHKVQWKKH